MHTPIVCSQLHHDPGYVLRKLNKNAYGRIISKIKTSEIALKLTIHFGSLSTQNGKVKVINKIPYKCNILKITYFIKICKNGADASSSVFTGLFPMIVLT